MMYFYSIAASLNLSSGLGTRLMTKMTELVDFLECRANV